MRGLWKWRRRGQPADGLPTTPWTTRRRLTHIPTTPTANF
jgi:hypothetical protein